MICAVVLASAAAGIPGYGAEAQPQWSIVACLDSRGGLSQAVDQYQQKLTEACQRLGLELAVLRLSAEAERPGTVRGTTLVLADGRLRPERVEQVSGVAEAVAATARAQFTRRPGRYHLVLMVAHGTGLLQADEQTGIDAVRLAGALSGVVGEVGRPLDVLGLDTCFGGSLENLWELRTCARYITAAPGLVYSPGLRWDEALEQTAAGAPLEVVNAVARLGMPGETADAALISLATERLEPVIAAVRELGTLLAGRLRTDGPLITLARSRSRSWGKRTELCDLVQWADVLAGNAGDADVRTAARGLGQAAREAVVATWPETAPAAVGIYFPPTFEAVPEAYQGLQFARTSGWYEFLGQYWQWVVSLVVGDVHPR